MSEPANEPAKMETSNEYEEEERSKRLGKLP